MLLHFLPAITAQNVMLTSTLSDDHVAHPQEKLVFLCETRGSLILEWYSDEFIGRNGERLQLLSIDCTSRNYSSNTNPNTVATCLHVSNEDGDTVILSQLCILVSGDFQTATVTCLNNGVGSRNSTTFQISPGK